MLTISLFSQKMKSRTQLSKFLIYRRISRLLKLSNIRLSHLAALLALKDLYQRRSTASFENSVKAQNYKKSKPHFEQRLCESGYPIRVAQTILTGSIDRQPGQTESLKDSPETIACYWTTISSQPPIKSTQARKLISQAYSHWPRETRTIRKINAALSYNLEGNLHMIIYADSQRQSHGFADFNRTESTNKFLITDHQIQMTCSLISRMKKLRTPRL